VAVKEEEKKNQNPRKNVMTILYFFGDRKGVAEGTWCPILKGREQGVDYGPSWRRKRTEGCVNREGGFNERIGKKEFQISFWKKSALGQRGSGRGQLHQREKVMGVTTKRQHQLGEKDFYGPEKAR